MEKKFLEFKKVYSGVKRVTSDGARRASGPFYPILHLTNI